MKSGMQQQNLMSAGSQVWVSNRAESTPVVQHFHCQVQPAAAKRRMKRKTRGKSREHTSKKYGQTSEQSLCRQCLKMRSCEEIATFSQYSLPKPRGEFASQGALLLALCKQGCASLTAGVWAVLLTRCKSQPMKLRGFFPPASDSLQLKVFQVLQGTLLSIEILVLEKKLSTQTAA